jgi:putative effector of murein hydrolase
MEGGLTMLLHSVIIGIILYLIMIYIFNQKQSVAINRSLILAALVLIYMILFGHGLPNKINKDVF